MPEQEPSAAKMRQEGFTDPRMQWEESLSSAFPVDQQHVRLEIYVVDAQTCDFDRTQPLERGEQQPWFDPFGRGVDGARKVFVAHWSGEPAAHSRADETECRVPQNYFFGYQPPEIALNVR